MVDFTVLYFRGKVGGRHAFSFKMANFLYIYIFRTRVKSPRKISFEF